MVKLLLILSMINLIQRSDVKVKEFHQFRTLDVQFNTPVFTAIPTTQILSGNTNVYSIPAGNKWILKKVFASITQVNSNGQSISYPDFTLSVNFFQSSGVAMVISDISGPANGAALSISGLPAPPFAGVSSSSVQDVWQSAYWDKTLGAQNIEYFNVVSGATFFCFFEFMNPTQYAIGQQIRGTYKLVFEVFKS